MPTRPSSHPHAPVHPSGLRQSLGDDLPPHDGAQSSGSSSHRSSRPDLSPRSRPRTYTGYDDDVDDMAPAGPGGEPLPRPPAVPTESTALLRGVLDADDGRWNHRTFAPRDCSPSASMTSADSGRGSGTDSASSVPILDGLITSIAGSSNAAWGRKWARKMRSKKMSTSSQLAERHGVKDTTLM